MSTQPNRSQAPTFASLAPASRHWAGIATRWMDRFWDDQAGLIWYPGPKAYGNVPDPARAHLVRETAWYVVGLLARRGPADVERACKALVAIARNQFDCPGRVHHGTFYRNPEEPAPGAVPREWADYDPNWREFIATARLLIHDDFGAVLPDATGESIRRMVRLAAEGSFERNVWAGYTNIALMSASLLDEAGARFGVAAWTDRARTLAQRIADRFAPERAFDEFNSPTYYGVDLNALAHWRRAPSPLLRELGAGMEADLWRDIARFYHAPMRNLCGPFDRSYGMDMRRHTAVAGLWIATLVESGEAPLPGGPDDSTGNRHDMCMMPYVAVLGTAAPDDALAELRSPRKARSPQVKRVLPGEPRRVATAVLTQRAMWGGEAAGGTRAAEGQVHPATMHWQLDTAEVGWLRVRCDTPVDATAEPDGLHVTGRPSVEMAVEIAYPAMADGRVAGHAEQETKINPGRWQLPGLTLDVQSPVAPLKVETTPAGVVVRFTHASVTLRVAGA